MKESSETLLRTRVAVDQVMLSRLATQSAIERSRTSLAETRALLVALRFAVRDRVAQRPRLIRGNAALEAQRLLAELTKIKNEDSCAERCAGRLTHSVTKSGDKAHERGN
jgi:hypothetical protein